MDYLYNPANATLYQTILDLHNEGKPVELVAISHRLIEKGKMDSIGGPSVIAERYSFVPTPIHLPYYIGILKNKYILRKTIESCNAVKESCYAYQDNIENIGDLASKAFQEIVGIIQNSKKSEPTIVDQVDEVMNDIEQAMLGTKVLSDPSPWRSWNSLIGGILKRYTVVKGEKGAGKSIFAMNLAHCSAITHNKPAIVFSYEMPAADYIKRMVCYMTGVDSRYIFHPDQFPPNHQQMRAIGDAITKIGKSPLYIYDNPDTPMSGIINRCEKIFEKHASIGIVAVDYVQRIKLPPKSKGESHEIQIAQLSDGLLGISRNYDCCVLALTHMNSMGVSRHSEMLENDAHLMVRINEDGLLIQKNRNGGGVGEQLKIGKFDSNCFQMKETAF